MRDIGGYPAADGMRVKWGKLFRSGSLWALNGSDWRWMDERGIRVVCDLRSAAEREIAPTVWRGKVPPRSVDGSYDSDVLFSRRTPKESLGIGALEGGLYLKFARLLAKSFAGLFDALQSGEAPAIVHCTAGQDRTGLAVALLLDVLGVARPTIHADYLLSTELRRPEFELDRAGLNEVAERNVVAAYYVRLIERHGPTIFTPQPLVDSMGRPLVDIAMDAIEREWGSIEAYFDEELGIGPAEQANLRAHLLEPA
ncbi:protein-tyrosine phosphatase [Sphingobium sp. OAS761]|nr:protein-tyrosine phosphatase [Sphingobium sp. OAS761]